MEKEEALREDYKPYSEMPITDFWNLVQNSSVKEMEELLAMLSTESNIMGEAFARNFQALNEIGTAGKIDFVENKDMHTLFQQSLGAYGFRVKIQERAEIVRYWMHEKMPDCFKH